MSRCQSIQHLDLSWTGGGGQITEQALCRWVYISIVCGGMGGGQITEQALCRWVYINIVCGGMGGGQITEQALCRWVYINIVCGGMCIDAYVAHNLLCCVVFSSRTV